jgi:hypothetical protein
MSDPVRRTKYVFATIIAKRDLLKRFAHSDAPSFRSNTTFSWRCRLCWSIKPHEVESLSSVRLWGKELEAHLFSHPPASTGTGWKLRLALTIAFVKFWMAELASCIKKPRSRDQGMTFPRGRRRILTYGDPLVITEVDKISTHDVQYTGS